MTTTTTQSQGANTLLANFYAALDDIEAVLLEETAFLMHGDYKGYLSLDARKQEAAAAYQEATTALYAARDELTHLSGAARAELSRRRNAFGKLAEKNAKALQRMVRTSQRLAERIRIIARDAAEQEHKVNYGARAGIRTSSKRGVSTGITETA